MKRHSTSGASILTLIVLATGCAATTAMAPSSIDAQAHALAPPSDRALVYLYRSEAFGGAVKMSVLIDGVFSGETVPHAYMLWEVAPGRHVITSKAENDEQLELNAEPGRAYFVWQEVKMGLMMARSRLHLVPEPEGRGELANCRLIDMPPDARAFNAGRPVAFGGPTAQATASSP